MRILLLALVALFMYLNSADITAAQPHTSLRIIVHDAQGAGIAGLEISVHAADDASLLAQSSTDIHGIALFPALANTAVRVVIAGQLSNGSMLYQRGSDAQGLWFNPEVASNELAFVVLANGLVELDPEGLIEGEQANGAVGEQVACEARELWSCGTELSGRRTVIALVLSLIIAGLVVVLRGRWI